MAPLEIEVYNEQVRNWVKGPEVKPVDPPGSISDNKPNGTRDIYLFECAPDDLKSTIYRSVLGFDLKSAENKRTMFFNPSKREVVKELAKGESHEMIVKTDRSAQPTRIRLTHR